jgi:diguanylate cyclase (GGDEF)-like protein/PAS domain S-box-containing protein
LNSKQVSAIHRLWGLGYIDGLPRCARWVYALAALFIYFSLLFVLFPIVDSIALTVVFVPGIVWAIMLTPRLAIFITMLLLIPNYFIFAALDLGRTPDDNIQLLISHIVISVITLVISQSYWLRHNQARELAERKKSEARFRGLFERTRDSVIIADTDLTIRDVNDQALQMLGYTRQFLIGKPYESLLPAERHAMLHERVARLLAGSPLNVYDQIYVKQDGDLIDVEINSALIRNQDGSPMHYQIISHDVTESKAAEKELYYKATHDHLTGLFNRAMFAELLDRSVEQVRRNNQELAVLFIDLDSFKDVNDTHGHLVGDMLLKESAQRLTALLRKSDVISRIGGDEFTVILEPISGKQYVSQIAETIVNALSTPFYLDGKQVKVSASVGTSFFPGDAEDAEKLLGKADQLMYGVKRDKRHP